MPCVALCPAGVDIPGYIALVGEERCADAVRLIRKDNPFPVACAYICEHPCEARCRRNMIDDAINIRGLKRYRRGSCRGCAPACVRPGHRVRPLPLWAAAPAALAAPTIWPSWATRSPFLRSAKQLGGMLRYGIPSYRFPRHLLDAEIASILSLGIEVHTERHCGQGYLTMEDLQKQYDCLYIAIGAHQDKKTGIPGEDSEQRHVRRGDAPRHRR